MLPDKKLSSVRKWICKSLENLYDLSEASSISFLLLEYHFKTDKFQLILNNERVCSTSDIKILSNYVQQLNEGKSIQHITGTAYFRNLILKVNNQVLIPRFETEELVQWVIDDNKEKESENTQTNLHIWDIGTGSGAIAISLDKEIKNSTTLGTDISENALNIAKHNGLKNASKATFKEHDILSGSLDVKRKFDIIVSNPPYVRYSEKDDVQYSVLKSEPHIALFVTNENPLLFYDRIAKAGKVNLKEKGKIYVEINQNLGEETQKLFEKNGYKNVFLKKDITGKERFIRCQL